MNKFIKELIVGLIVGLKTSANTIMAMFWYMVVILIMKQYDLVLSANIVKFGLLIVTLGNGGYYLITYYRELTKPNK